MYLGKKWSFTTYDAWDAHVLVAGQNKPVVFLISIIMNTLWQFKVANRSFTYENIIVHNHANLPESTAEIERSKSCKIYHRIPTPKLLTTMSHSAQFKVKTRAVLTS